MRCLFFADLHAHNYREFAEINEHGINSRLQHQLDFLESLIEPAKTVDIITFLGDLYQLKNNVDSKVMRNVMNGIKKLIKESNKKLIIVPGNHDYYYWGKEPVLIDMLGDMLDMLFIGSEINNYEEFEDWNFFIFPFYRDVEALKKEVISFDNQKNSVALFHNDISGFKFDTYWAKTGIDLKDISSRFTYSFLGHFHGMSQVADNVFYVGAPMQRDFGESKQQKGYMILDTNSDSVEFHENTEALKFIDLEITSGGDYSLNDKKNYYRIVIKTSEAVTGLETIKWKRVSYELSSKSAKERSSISFSDSDDSVIKKYVESRNISLDANKLIEIGKRYLQ